MCKNAIFFVIACLFVFCGLSFAQDPFEVALKEVGLTRESMRFDYRDMSNF